MTPWTNSTTDDLTQTINEIMFSDSSGSAGGHRGATVTVMVGVGW